MFRKGKTAHRTFVVCVDHTRRKYL